jgi:hypothetical protein
MSTRPFTDITVAISGNPIKNGTLVIGVQKTGSYKTNNNNVSNSPTIETISDKYGYRFYNGIFVTLTGDQTVIGG